MQSFRACFHVKEGAHPKICRPRAVSFAIKESMGRELDHLEEAGIVIKENYSEWAVPIVPVPKKDGSIHVCGDFKVTINPFLNVDQYPLPKPDSMTCLTGGKISTKLDLTAPYQQMLLDNESSKLVVINTIKACIIIQDCRLELLWLLQYSKKLWTLSCKEYFM